MRTLDAEHCMQIFQTGKSWLPHHVTRRGLCRDLATGNGNERKWSSAGGNITVCLDLQRRNVQTDLKECSHTSPSLPHCPMFGISQAASLHHFYTALQLQLSTMKGSASNQHTVSRALEAGFGAILN